MRFPQLSKLDVLVNNAGLELITPLSDEGDEVDATFARIIDINVNGTWNVTRAALPLLKPGSRIINTASVWAKSAVGEFAAYIASSMPWSDSRGPSPASLGREALPSTLCAPDGY